MKRALAMLLSLAPVTACSGSDDAVHGDPYSDVTAIAIAPAEASLALALGGSVTQRLTLSARLADGSTRDVTASARWSVSGGPASAPFGGFATSTAGVYTVSASLGARLARATVTVRVTGEAVLPDAPPTASGALGGSVPAGASAPVVAYPLEGAIFPANLGTTEVHVTRTHASQSLVRVQFVGTLIDVTMVARCRAIPRAPMGCAVTVDRSLVSSLVGASEGAVMQLRVRLAAPDGAQLSESAPRDVRWTAVNLTGALYYWSTRLGDNATAIYRYNLETPAPPEPYFLQTRDAPVVASERPCVGCHTLSRDGRRMALAFGGSDPGAFGVYDVATRRPVATRLGARAYGAQPGFATMSALSPDGSRIVTAHRGVMTLRRVDDTLGAIGGPLFASGLTPGDRVTQPYWSSDGRTLTFVGFNPSMYDCSMPPCGDARPRDNGDLAPYGQVYTAAVDGDAIGPARLLVARSSGGGREYTSHYPAISDDGRWMVFNRVRCDARGNDQGYAVDRTASAANCSGYDNPGTRVMFIPVAGGAPVDLARLNDTRTWTNSWPRWAPNHGRFRGAELYWVAFSTKRPYGLRLAGDDTGRLSSVPPQLWFAAITLGEGDIVSSDPSHAPIWLPQQNSDEHTPSGNHVPQWTAVFVPTPG